MMSGRLEGNREVCAKLTCCTPVVPLPLPALSDFSCGDLSALEPDSKAICTPDGIRRRTFAVSQASALAAGIWGSATAAANHAPEPSTLSPYASSCINSTIAPSSLVPHGRSTIVEAGLGTDYSGTAAQLGGGEKGGKQESVTANEQLLQQQQQQQRLPSEFVGHGRAALELEGRGAAVPSVGGNSGRKRKSSGISGGKRPLNPERMERKASREKRRREEVRILWVFSGLALLAHGGRVGERVHWSPPRDGVGYPRIWPVFFFSSMGETDISCEQSLPLAVDSIEHALKTGP